MKISKLIKPLFTTWAAAQVLMDTGQDAFASQNHRHSRHIEPWRHNAMKCSGAAFLSLAFGGLAILSFLKMEKQSRKHQEWKKADAKLDSALEDSLDASDPVAKY